MRVDHLEQSFKIADIEIRNVKENLVIDNILNNSDEMVNPIKTNPEFKENDNLLPGNDNEESQTNPHKQSSLSFILSTESNVIEDAKNENEKLLSVSDTGEKNAIQNIAPSLSIDFSKETIYDELNYKENSIISRNLHEQERLLLVKDKTGKKTNPNDQSSLSFDLSKPDEMERVSLVNDIENKAKQNNQPSLSFNLGTEPSVVGSNNKEDTNISKKSVQGKTENKNEPNNQPRLSIDLVPKPIVVKSISEKNTKMSRTRNEEGRLVSVKDNKENETKRNYQPGLSFNLGLEPGVEESH